MEPGHRALSAYDAQEPLLRLRQELNEEKDSRIPDLVRKLLWER